MSSTRKILIGLALLLAGYVAWRLYMRLPWIRISATAHAERGAVNCGDVLQSDGEGVAADAIKCAIAAQDQRRPFRVTFSVSGTDDYVSFGLVGDSKGNAMETMYAMGTVQPRNTLLRHRCDFPVQLQATSDHPYGIPLLHCAPWPPRTLERDWLLW
jgi:hypothetical protein